MKIKLDENIPTALADLLAAFGHDVHTVQSEGLKGKKDSAIWQACCEERRFLVTQDVAFADARLQLGLDHPGVLVVRVREPGKQAVMNRILEVFGVEDVTSWARAVAVATPNKVRVRRGN